MSNRYKYIPSGLDYKSYTMEAKTDNEYIVNYNINNIQYLYNHLTIIEEWISNLPDISDLSGYYTKEEIDLLLENYYTIEEIDNTFSLYYNKQETDLLFGNYYTKNEIDDNFSLYYNKEEADDLFVDWTTYNLNLSDLNTRISTNEDNITTNTNNITTLTNNITANFNTFGRYEIQGMSLSDSAGEVRFIIIEKIPLDNNYVNVSLNPNQFLNLVKGNVTFNIIADGIINNDVNDLTLELKIYLNDNVIDNESKVVEAGKTISINYANSLPVDENDVVYATLEIISGEGILSTINPVIINISVQSTSNGAVKSSTTVNDYQDLPNNGINPKLNQVDTNTTNITNLDNKISINSGDITDILNKIDAINLRIDRIDEEKVLFENASGANTENAPITLNERWDNFKELVIIGFLTYDNYKDKSIIINIPTSIIYSGGSGLQKKFIELVTGGGDQWEIEFTSLTQIQQTWVNSSERITKVIGKGRIANN